MYVGLNGLSNEDFLQLTGGGMSTANAGLDIGPLFI